MTTDLSMLIWSAVLCLSLPAVHLIGRVVTPGGVVPVGELLVPAQLLG